MKKNYQWKVLNVKWMKKNQNVSLVTNEIIMTKWNFMIR